MERDEKRPKYLRDAVFVRGEISIARNRKRRERIEGIFYCSIYHALLTWQSEYFSAFRTGTKLRYKLTPVKIYGY